MQKNKNIIYIAISTLALLTVPLVLTLLGSGVDGDGWHWTFFDFVFAFVLIFGTGSSYELIRRRTGVTTYRVAAGLALLTSFILVWGNAAVGLIGDGPINGLYPAIVVIMIIGSVIARLEPNGMVRALVITAIAQALVPVIALVMHTPNFSPGVLQVFALNSVFVAAYLTSALLFKYSASLRPNHQIS